ncbi:Phenylpropionate dioxygenase, large terminal subunit [Nannocystis exedens]|uniref:Phenylpropionate dioxygenase, large terminal subunit n=1 Tax=Nannocystis exedens TaxID=54 RepID=A0A1I1Y6Y0_9BACT|nr:aromatic ring-hydroxylating dioxygenase subunit alpha [Nannocystis exedens]PCC71848.1 Methylxanthine N3-demethylase NdmB [Nannocystis exedens]SFE15169.1 Phenylpropionate dioxygenase, large terminal subunit [Nannocystis exedens]
MFRGFAHVWTIVGLDRDLKRRAALPLQVAGERVVLFRDGQGRACALVDRCPHRGVRLSLGKVQDGCIECPFHGWRFAGDGSNQLVPWNPDARRERLGATPLPVRERAGLLWLYTAPGLAAPSEPDIPDVLQRDDLSLSGFTMIFDAHWTRVMENSLDWPHLPFVHQRTIRDALPLRPGSRLDISWEDRPWGGRTTTAIDGVAQPITLDYRFPNTMHLHLPAGKRIFELMLTALPVDDTTTRVLMVTIRDFLRSRLFDLYFEAGGRKIGGEDRAVIETSSPREVPPAGDERSVRTDEPTLRFRKVYRDRLMDSIAGEPDR